MKRLALAAFAVLAVAACDPAPMPPTHANPQEGRVTMDYSDCSYGQCIYDWKICIGSALEIHFSRPDTDEWQRVVTVQDSPECKPSPKDTP